MYKALGLLQEIDQEMVESEGNVDFFTKIDINAEEIWKNLLTSPESLIALLEMEKLVDRELD